jgi:hypothetical protein
MRAENLGDNVQQSFVMMYQADKMVQTNVQRGKAPVYQESLQFDIEDDRQPLVVNLVDAVSNRDILRTQIKIE